MKDAVEYFFMTTYYLLLTTYLFKKLLYSTENKSGHNFGRTGNIPMRKRSASGATDASVASRAVETILPPISAETAD